MEMNYIVDNLDTYMSNRVLSAKQGALLNDKIEVNQQDIADLKADKIDANLVYSKAEADGRYYTQSYIDGSIYTKTDVYTKQEVDNMMYSLESAIQQLAYRLDKIVELNNLIDYP
jgi:hypothetical protein